MSSVSGIRIDSLLHSLKELQNEKQCLEQKLNGRRNQAQTLEGKVDHYNTKLIHLKEMNQKLTEMQKVAVQKVNQTQQLIDSLHELNQTYNNKIKSLNSQVQKQKDQGHKNVEAFQEELSALSKKLMNARKFYKTEALRGKIEEIHNRISLNQSSVQTDGDDVTSLASTMDCLQLTPPEQRQSDSVSHHTRLLMWSMLEKEEFSLKARLHRLQAKNQEICAVLQESNYPSTSQSSTPAKLDE